MESESNILNFNFGTLQYYTVSFTISPTRSLIAVSQCEQMDRRFNSSEQIQDTLTCLLCQAVICYKNRDKKKFFNHMRRDHGAFYNIGLILIINLLDKRTSIKLIQDIYREKYTRSNTGELPDIDKPKEAFAQTEPSVVDAEVQTDFTEVSESKFSGGEFLSDLQHFVTNLQLGTTQMTEQESWAETEISSESETSAGDDLYIPSDIELDEAIPTSTPNSKDVLKIKQEKIDYFIPPDSTLDPIEIFLDCEDFNILDVTKEDLVLTPGGPMPISDYSNFLPGALIPPQYEPNEEVERPDKGKCSDPNDKNSDAEKRKRKTEVYSRDSESTKKQNTKEKDLVCLYLKEESQYFKKTKNEISSSSRDRAVKFTEADETLPEGWKCRTFTRKNGRVDYEYLSPELKVLRSRVGVVEYMKAMGGYTELEMAGVLPVRIKKEKLW